MNCKQIQKYLYAFADGQLDVQVNCDVLDHLKMCRQCAGIVDDHQLARTTLRNHLEQVPVPDTLPARLRKSIQPPRIVSAGRNWRVLVPLGLATAASVGWAVNSVWTAITPSHPANRFPDVVDGGPIIPLSDTLAAKITEKHLLCCSHHDQHQSSDLPASLASAADAIARHFEMSIKVLAPDLASHGFRFESANFCGIDSPECTKGGHFLYVAQNGRDRFSVFSVPRKDCLSKCGGGAGRGEGSLRVFRRELDDGSLLRVVLWNQDASTHICCGAVDQSEMTRIVADVQLAMERNEIKVVLATLAWSR